MKHFIQCVVPGFPLLLLLDGHSMQGAWHYYVMFAITHNTSLNHWTTHGMFDPLKVAENPVLSRSTNLESKLIDFFVLLIF